MRYSKTLSSVALAALLASSAAVAGERHYGSEGYYINARVVEVDPVVRRVRVAHPEEMCWSEPTRYREHRRDHRDNEAAPTIIGGVVGGVVGNQIGRHNDHRSGMTIAGALVGAAIGHSVGKSHNSRHRGYERHAYHEPYCETRTEYRVVERIVAYDVTYRYRGRYFTTRTDDPPGKRIRVRVDHEPAARYSGFTDSRHRYPSDDHYCDDDCA